MGTLALTVTNAGGQASERQEIAVELPKGARLLSVTTSEGACKPDGTTRCTLPPIPGQVEPASEKVVLSIGIDPPGASGIVRVTIDGESAETKIDVAATPTQLKISELSVVQVAHRARRHRRVRTHCREPRRHALGPTACDGHAPKGAEVTAIQAGTTTCVTQRASRATCRRRPTAPTGDRLRHLAHRRRGRERHLVVDVGKVAESC